MPSKIFLTSVIYMFKALNHVIIEKADVVETVLLGRAQAETLLSCRVGEQEL